MLATLGSRSRDRRGRADHLAPGAGASPPGGGTSRATGPRISGCASRRQRSLEVDYVPGTVALVKRAGVRARRAAGRGLLLWRRDGGPVPSGSASRVPVGDGSPGARAARPRALGPGAPDAAPLLHRAQSVSVRAQALSAAASLALRALDRRGCPERPGGARRAATGAGRGRSRWASSTASGGALADRIERVLAQPGRRPASRW